jgi:hypothetical protein
LGGFSRTIKLRDKTPARKVRIITGIRFYHSLEMPTNKLKRCFSLIYEREMEDPE